MAKNKQQIKFEADISGFKSAIKEGEQSVRSLNKELKLNQEQLKGNSNNVDLLTTRAKTLKQEYEQQNKIIEESNKCYQKAVELFGEYSDEARIWKDKIVDAETKQQKIKNALDETNKTLNEQSNKLITLGTKWQESGGKIEKVGEKINKVGNGLSVVSAGVAGGLVATAKSAIDYESAFAGVEKTVNATDEQLQVLNKEILDMSTRMPAAATEIAGVAESAGQLGIGTEDILSFTEVMINLGEATNLSSEEAASALAKFANITGMSAKEYDKLGSVIVDLGNNFATTEADIVGMATRLAATGELTGLTEPQIMALATAMSSVGIEAEAGGSAMSKLLKQIQVAVETGNKDLTKFAKVAGKSTKEFKQSFEKDAVEALGLFLNGLQDTERNGKSAIAILDDMGLTEVRLSNTILSLSNANGVLTDAISTANNAWKDNTALTKEVDKRYGTTESQMKMLKNEVQKLAIEFGRELLPSLTDLVKDAKPLLTTVSNAVKTFSNLDDKTKKNIVSLAGLVVTAGPVVKIIGNITSGVGKVTSVMGKMSEKIGNVSSETVNLDKNANGLGTTFSALGIATIGVGTAIGIAKAQLLEENKAYYELRNEIDDTISSRKSLNDVTLESVNTSMTEANRIETLKDKLAEIVDSNGKVKDGYKNRASYIVNELKNATGIEIELLGDTIKGYKELGEKIDDVITKKKTEAVYNALEQKFGDSSANLEKYKKQLEEAMIKEKELWEAYNKSLKTLNPIEAIRTKDRLKDAQEATTKVQDMQRVVNEAMDDIAQYNYATDLMADGSNEAMEKIYNSYVYGVANISNATEVELEKTIQNISESMDYYSTKTDEASQKAYEEQQKMLKETAQTLSNATATVDTLSPNLINAWTTLAKSSTTSYAEALSGLDDEVVYKIQEATGRVVSDEELETAFRDLGRDSIDGFKESNFEQAGSDAAGDIKKGAENSKNSLFSTGSGLGSSLMNGLKSTFSVGGITGIISAIKGSHADGLAYVPYNGYVARLHEGERVLTKKENAEYMRNNISNKNNNITVNFYPQQMTEAELEKASRYINKKWGMGA